MERDQFWITWELNKIKMNPMANRRFEFFPIGRRNFHLERDDNILLLSNKQPNEKSQNAHPSDHPKVNRSRDKYTKTGERKLHLMYIHYGVHLSCAFSKICLHFYCETIWFYTSKPLKWVIFGQKSYKIDKIIDNLELKIVIWNAKNVILALQSE